MINSVKDCVCGGWGQGESDHSRPRKEALGWGTALTKAQRLERASFVQEGRQGGIWE